MKKMMLTILLASLCSMVFAQTIIMDNTDDLGNAIDRIGSFWDDDIALIFTTNDVPYDLYSVSLAPYFYMNVTSDVTFSIKLANSSNEPTGSVLASETFYDQSFSDVYTYKTYTFSSLDDYTFSSNTKYALVVSTSKNIWMLPVEYSELPASSFYTVHRTAMLQTGTWYDFNYFAIRVKGTANTSAPTLTTDSIITFDTTSATMGGSISSNGGAMIEERGVVYSSTDKEPEIGDTGVTKDENTSGLDNFSESISGLFPGTTYYVQAYATNSTGTSYGGVKSFTTESHFRTINAGSYQTFRSDVAYNLMSTRLSDNKILNVYQASSSSSSNRYAIVGVVNPSTKTVSWGSPLLIGSGFLGNGDVVALSPYKAVVFVEYNSSPDLMQYCVLTIDGTTITKGTLTTFTSDEVSYQKSYKAVSLSENQVVACYERASSSDLQVMTGMVDGTTITWGSSVTFSSSNTAYTNLCRLNDSKFAIAWEDDDTSPDSGKMRIGTINGTTVTPGTSMYTFQSSSAVGVLAVTALSEDSFALSWEDDGNANDIGKIQLATVSGTEITMQGTAASFLQDINNDLCISALSETEVIVAMSAAAGSPDYYAYCVLDGNDFAVETKMILNNRADDAEVCCLTYDLFTISYIDYYNAEGTNKYGLTKVMTLARGDNPEINVQGNSIDILLGDTTPSTANYTDFGTGSSLSRIFTIQNLGDGILTLGANSVSITGANASDFSVNLQPSTSVGSSSFTTFIIDFASTVASTRTAEIHINSNDIHEHDYFFSIQAVGSNPTPPGLWTGATSTDWNTDSNWFGDDVPTSTVDVTIPEGCSIYPIIDENAVCQDFTIENGGSVQINSSYSLNIAGDFTLDDGSSFTNNGMLQFSGDDCHLNDDRTDKNLLGNILIED